MSEQICAKYVFHRFLAPLNGLTRSSESLCIAGSLVEKRGKAYVQKAQRDE